MSSVVEIRGRKKSARTVVGNIPDGPEQANSLDHRTSRTAHPRPPAFNCPDSITTRQANVGCIIDIRYGEMRRLHLTVARCRVDVVRLM